MMNRRTSQRENSRHTRITTELLEIIAGAEAL